MKKASAKLLFVSLVCLSTLIFCAHVYASNSTTLDEITVTTTSLGQEKNVEDVQASVEVVGKKDIEQSNARSVPQLLNNSLGVDVKDGGSTSSISIRGFDDSHTLILVDGMRRTGKYGSSDLSTIALEDIEKIEIVRGPMSALYGADGVAGVVNIITKKDYDEDYMKATILGGIAQNGERGTYIAKLNGAIVQERMTHNYAVEVRKKDEYRFEESSIATDLRNESRQFLSYANGLKINDNNKLNTRLEYSRQDDDGTYYSAPPFGVGTVKSYEKEDRYQISTQFNHVNEDKNFIFDSNLAYGFSDTDINRGSGSETTDYKQFEFNNYFRHYTFDNMTNILGAGYKNEEIDVSIYSKKASRDNFNLLFQSEYYITDAFIANLGVRYDDFSDFGSATTPKASLMYKFSNINLRASYGESFKAPNFTNMYSTFARGPYIINGNENLKPEESTTYEFAINYKINNFAFEVIHHRTKLDNLIAAKPVDPTNFIPPIQLLYKNIAKATIDGTEISTQYRFDSGFGVNVGWEHLDTNDEETNERLTGSARTTLKVDLSYEIDALGVYLLVKKYNDYYGTDETRTDVLSDHTVADIKVNYDISDTINWFIGVDNIQDKKMPYNMRLFGTPNDPGERFYYSGMSFSF